jgi:hypothetical protein
MNGMGTAKAAVFFEFHTIGMLALILSRSVITLFTLGTG